MNEHEALVQGVLVGTMLRMQMEGGPVAIALVTQDTDDAGNYLRGFDVTLKSGVVVRVSVEVAADPETVLNEIAARVTDFEYRVHADIETTLRRYGVRAADPDQQEDLVSDLVNDTLHPIEQLLTEKR